MCKLTVQSPLFGSVNVCRPLKQNIMYHQAMTKSLSPKDSQLMFIECPNITDLTAMLVLMYHSDKIFVDI